MSELTTFKVGGPADTVFQPKDVDSLVDILSICHTHSIPMTIIGNGSNLIVRDGGIRGIVIRICDVLNCILRINSSNNLMVGAGTSVEELIQYCIKNNLKGPECLCGIPGTIGGCIYMNAGYTGEIAPLVEKVVAVHKSGSYIKEFKQEEMAFGYRTSVFHNKEYIILHAFLCLTPGDCRETVEKYKAHRKKTQPIDYPSCGSVFKRANLQSVKGMAVGDAEVSTLCPSFIINKGRATAGDILHLIQNIQDKLGPLELEAEIIGE